MNHGFWSMMQTVGWNGDTWMPRLKTIAAWWTSIVVGLFIIQAVVFTVKANSCCDVTSLCSGEECVVEVVDSCCASEISTE